jgi:hypothetical protein
MSSRPRSPGLPELSLVLSHQLFDGMVTEGCVGNITAMMMVFSGGSCSHRRWPSPLLVRLERSGGLVTRPVGSAPPIGRESSSNGRESNLLIVEPSARGPLGHLMARGHRLRPLYLVFYTRGIGLDTK